MFFSKHSTHSKQGNVFTGVCHCVHGEMVHPEGMHPLEVCHHPQKYVPSPPVNWWAECFLLESILVSKQVWIPVGCVLPTSVAISEF